MAFSEADFEAFLQLLRDRPELLERAREVLLPPDWRTVPAALGRLSGQNQEILAELASLREDMRSFREETNERFGVHEVILRDITNMLRDMQATLRDHDSRLAEHSRLLADHSRLLADHTRQLAEHTRLLNAILLRLPENRNGA